MTRATSEQGSDANRDMIDMLVGAGRIRNPRIEDAFRAVPRHWFLPDHDLDEVYGGRAIATHTGSDRQPISSSSEPGIMAVMLEQLDIRHDRPEPTAVVVVVVVVVGPR